MNLQGFQRNELTEDPRRQLLQFVPLQLAEELLGKRGMARKDGRMRHLLLHPYVFMYANPQVYTYLKVSTP